jgi:hypothetical protein
LLSSLPPSLLKLLLPTSQPSLCLASLGKIFRGPRKKYPF